MGGLDYLIYSVTRAYRFSYAYSLGDGRPAEDELKLSDVEILCRKASDFGVKNIFLTGVGESGDPFIRDDIHEILRLVYDYGLGAVYLKTDGASLKSESLRVLSKYDVKVILSMAGPKDVDSLLRSEGLFERSVEIAKKLADNGVLYSLSMPLTKYVVGRVDDIVELALKVGARRVSLSTLIPQPLVFGREHILNRLKPLEPTPQQREEVLKQVFKINKEFKEGLISVWFEPYDIFYHRILKSNIPEINLETPCELHLNQERFSWLEVLDNGALSTCSALGIWNGDIRVVETFYDVFNEIRRSEYVRRLIKKENIVGKCGRCEYYAVCAGCRARAYQYTGNPFLSDPVCPYIPQR